eukprot:TRINITY_DN3600_c0_g1_i1.p1 TRINITY_DN3600_c0_g1~~TRINITY_DN3600_c0_g1_i1.p1  ORF type:complete len:857 (-),score=363.05 TRINITY_DN3600_c0_g1_i1:28-2598(-)
MSELSQSLQNALSHDQNVRAPAEQLFLQAEAANLPAFLHQLGLELVREDQTEQARKLAGVILKNSLDGQKYPHKAARWLEIDPTLRNQLKTTFFTACNSGSRDVRSQASQVVARVALIELPKAQWPDLIQALLANMTNPASSSDLKQSTLEILGYICEDIDEVSIRDYSNQILTAVVQGMSTQGSNDVLLAAATALFNALSFVRTNFEVETERDYIVGVVLTTIKIDNSDVQVVAYQCLVRIAELYYSKLAKYMPELFNLTMSTIKNELAKKLTEPSPIALQAIEFWSTICDEEIEILEDIDYGDHSRVCEKFVQKALPFLMPQLTEALTRQEEDASEENWNEAMAAATCLSLIASAVPDEVVDQAMPFVNANIENPDWRYREAATMTFGSILEGVQSVERKNIIVMSLPVLVAHLADPNEHVKDTTAWTIGRICQIHSKCIDPAFIGKLVEAICSTLGEAPRVASNASWALHNIALSLQLEDTPESSPLSTFFIPCVQLLIKTTERGDANENNLGVTAFEATNMFITAAPRDCFPTVRELVPYFINRLEKTFVQIQQSLSQEDKEELIKTQSLICGSLQVIIQTFQLEILPYADQIMTSIIKLFSIKSTILQDEGLLALGAMATAIGDKFEKYLQHIINFVLTGLANWEAETTCTVSVQLVGDLCRALTTKMFPFCDEIMAQLLANLRNPALFNSIRPIILSCFGDIALGVGPLFEKYYEFVLAVLQQASSTTIDTSDPEMVDYLNQLRESIFEALIGLVQGMDTGDKTKGHPILNHVEFAVNYFEYVYSDQNKTEEVVKAGVGLIGDLAHVLGSRVSQLLKRPSLLTILKELVHGADRDLSSVALWAAQVIQRI